MHQVKSEVVTGAVVSDEAAPNCTADRCNRCRRNHPGLQHLSPKVGHFGWQILQTWMIEPLLLHLHMFASFSRTSTEASPRISRLAEVGSSCCIACLEMAVSLSLMVLPCLAACPEMMGSLLMVLSWSLTNADYGCGLSNLVLAYTCVHVVNKKMLLEY